MSQPYFEIRSSPIQGRGAFAIRRIRKGTRIIEYVGERISHAEADRRYDDSRMKRHHTFLFTLDRRTVIDAGVNGNEARFINHSCDPNCEAVIDSGHIYIEAIKTIQPGEELVYDYQYERAPDADESDEARYPCNCGSPKCRGTILAPPKRRRAAAATKRRKTAAKRKKRGKTVTRRKKVASKAGSRKKASKRGASASKRRGSVSRRAGKSPARSKGSRSRRGAATRGRKSA